MALNRRIGVVAAPKVVAAHSITSTIPGEAADQTGAAAGVSGAAADRMSAATGVASEAAGVVVEAGEVGVEASEATSAASLALRRSIDAQSGPFGSKASAFTKTTRPGNG
jgi:hypothetical protein